MPNLMGVKFTDEHIMDFVLCAQLAGGKYNMLFGRYGNILFCFSSSWLAGVKQV